MVKDAERLAQFERDQARRPGRDLSYEQALRLFESLWQQARVLGALDTVDPLRGLEADIEIARTLNARREAVNGFVAASLLAVLGDDRLTTCREQARGYNFVAGWRCAHVLPPTIPRVFVPKVRRRFAARDPSASPCVESRPRRRADRRSPPLCAVKDLRTTETLHRGATTFLHPQFQACSLRFRS
jgi:hypothetical protein